MNHNTILSMERITKRFPGVLANDEISFDLRLGEVHSLLGENGAGKSTLMGILSGLHKPDDGKIFINNKEVRFDSPRDSIAKGIGMVYQHFMLIPQLSVVENIMLGVKQPRWPLLDVAGTAQKIMDFAVMYNMEIDPYAKVWQLSVGQQQRVEILKALYKNAQVLVLDEPTAVLTPHETRQLMGMIHQYTQDGHAVVFISHKIDEVLEISNRVSVLRRGRLVDTLENTGLEKGPLASLMVGRQVDFSPCKRRKAVGVPVLEVSNVSAGNSKGLSALNSISFTLHAGEILGVAGVDGNGQSELVEVLTGLRHATSGEIRIQGEDVSHANTRTIMNYGVGHIPEDRHKSGLVVDFNLEENFILLDYYEYPHDTDGFLNWKYIHGHAESTLQAYDVRMPSIKVLARTLSGGNQQKLILARELHRNPKLLIAMHATSSPSHKY